VTVVLVAVVAGGAQGMTYPYIVEAGSGGLNNGNYAEYGANWLSSSGHSTAAGLTEGIGSRYTTAVGSYAEFKLNADFLADGLPGDVLEFEVFATWPTTSNTSYPTQFDITSDDDPVTLLIDQNLQGGDEWLSLGTYTFTANTDYFVTITAINDQAYPDARCDAVKWELVPEPATASLLTAGSLLLLRRRRRA